MTDREMIEAKLRLVAAQRGFHRCLRDDDMWTEGRSRRPNTARDEAKAIHKAWLRVLRRHGAEEPEILALANEIERHPLHMNAASIAFMWLFQRFMVKRLEAVLTGEADGWSVVSVVDRRCRAAEGLLDSTIFDRLGRHLTKALLDLGIYRAIGGFDLSANEYEDDSFPPHYRPHAWFFSRTKEIRGNEAAFRSRFKASPLVPRPVVIKPWDGNLGALAYAFKPQFGRRVSLNAGNTRVCDLRASQKLEVARAMHEAGPEARLFLHGYQMDETGAIHVRKTAR